MKITIKKVDKTNFPSFIALVKELAKYEKLAPPDNAAVKRLKKDSISSRPKIESYLAYVNEKPIGYMILLMTYSSFLAKSTLYIEDIFILKEYRQKRIGQKMFDFYLTYQTARLYAVLMVTGLLGYALNKIFRLIEIKVLHWIE